MRSIGRGDDVGGVDAGGEFLLDPLKQPLRAGALDLHRDAGILRLEGLAELFADRQIHRGIKHDLAFALRGLDQLRRDRDRLRRRRLERGGEHGKPSAADPLMSPRLDNFRRFIVPSL